MIHLFVEFFIDDDVFYAHTIYPTRNIHNIMHEHLFTTHSAYFNKKFFPTWHCIVGRNFAANITHETKNYHYFYLGQMGFLLWKA
jgi:hypothetical protein